MNNMQSLIADFVNLTENNDIDNKEHNRWSERYTIETIRMKIREAGGTVVLESCDWGQDRVILFDVETWTGPDDGIDHQYCVLFWCMDGYVASFAGPLDLKTAHAQWSEWTKDEIDP